MKQWISAGLLLLSAAFAIGQPPQAGDKETLRRERDLLQRRSRDQYRLHLFDEALRSAREALRLTEQLDGAESSAAVSSLDWVFQLHMDRDEYKLAAELSQRVLVLRRKLDAERPWLIRDAEVFDRYLKRVLELSTGELERLKEMARDLEHANQLAQFGKTSEAIQLEAGALEKRLRLLGFIDHMYARHLGLQAMRLMSSKKTEAAGIKLMEKAVAVNRELYGEQHRDCAALLQGLALIHKKRGELDKAVVLYIRASDVFHTVLGKDHETSTRAVELLAQAQRTLAEKAIGKGDLDAAAKHLEAEIAAWQKGHGKGHWREREAESKLRETRFLGKTTSAQEEALDQAMERFKSAEKLGKQGKTQQALGQMTRAAETFQEVLPPRHHLTLKALWNQAVLHADAGERDRADAVYRLCLEQTRDELGLGHPQLVERLDEYLPSLARRLTRHIARAEFKDAVRVLRLSGEFEQLRHPGQTWRAKTVQARIEHLERRGKLPKEALERLAEADRLMEESPELFEKKQFLSARERLRNAAAIRQDLLGEADYETVDALFSLASVDVMVNNLADAARNFRKVLAQREQSLGKTHSQYAFALREFANLQEKAGNLNQAIETSEEALAILKTTLGKDQMAYADSLVILASRYMKLRRVDRANDLVEEALPLLEKAQGKDRSAYASALNLTASMYGRVRPEFAIGLSDTACAIWRELKDPLQYAIVRDNQGGLYQFLGNLQEAEVRHKEALNIFQSLLGERHPTTAVGLSNLSSLYSLQKKFALAAATQRRALHASRFSLTLASAAQTEQQQLTAFDHFRRDLDVFLTLSHYSPSAPDSAWEEVLAWKGQTLNQQRDSRLARTMPELEPLVAKLRGLTARLASLALSVPASAEQRRWRQQVDDLTAEREKLEGQLAAAIAEKRGGKPMPVPTPAVIKAALPESAAVVDFFVYRHAGRADAKRPSGRYLLAFVVRPGKPVELVDLGLAERIGTAVDRWLKDYGKDSSAALQTLLWQPLEKHLAGIDTILISPDGPLGRFPFGALPGKKPGSYLIEDVRIAAVPVPQLLPELLGDMKAPLGKPSLLLAGDIGFDAAPGRALPPLSFTAGPLPTEEILKRAPKSERPLPSGRLLTFDPLPDTAKEMSAIARVFEESVKTKAQELAGKEATEEAFRAAAPGKTHLHLATHGFFAPARLRSALEPSEDVVPRDPAGRPTRTHPALLSGIALAGANRGPQGDAQLDDGILTAAELAEIDLTKARLVVLSACSTGLGDTAGGEGLLGLQRALHVAGARSAVTSLWAVPDEATRVLMAELYTNLWAGKMKTLDALREAQITVMKRYEVKGKQIVRAPRGERPIVPLGEARLSPIYWAGFVLSGDWR